MDLFIFAVIVVLCSQICYVYCSIIIVEDAKACFRRALAGKRIARRFVRRSLICESVQDCHLECGDERSFICEGFNYRLDPSGRGKGECELLDIPLVRIDIGRDVYPDREFDYYERDRNAALSNCHSTAYYPANRYPDNYRRPPYRPPPRPPAYPQRWPNKPYERPYDRPPPPFYDDRYRPGYNRREDYFYHQSYHYGHNKPYEYPIDQHFGPSGTHYLPPNPSPRPIYDSYDHYKPYKPYGYELANRRHDYHDTNYHKHNYYLPNKIGGTKDWGQYGGSYGNGGLLPLKKPVGYLPQKPSVEIHITHQGPNVYDIADNSILPLEPRYPLKPHYGEDCSLRSATGFKLTKRIVKKFFAVPNIYECELLCYKERDFPCASYAFRYSISLSAPSDNCYLSNKNYKDLDYYIDIEPDRDFDIYTMDDKIKCQAPAIEEKESSECFWRVRSGQRLDHRVVRDTISVQSIVECQLQCLQSRKFTCRAFAYRYGSPSPYGLHNNCQLTDWPFFELEPKKDFIPEPGFEVYERGSYGHGCEPNHFSIRGRHEKDPATEIDQLCYIGFGSPAKLLPQATKKSVKVSTELDCKVECSKFREGSLFQCMSFSFKTSSFGLDNCFLSDILQRDLLPHIDYVHDPDSWLFAWDNFNPQCIDLAYKPVHSFPPQVTNNHIGIKDKEGRFSYIEIYKPLDTWRAYSVSGWPCKRGSTCRENREAGFWFCELEGGDANAWDYCCRPDHQCGYSYGLPYQWCYVGPAKTQWRKCSDRYYPYIHNLIDRIDYFHEQKPHSYLPTPPTVWRPDNPNHYLPIDSGAPLPVLRPGFRPDRPPAFPRPTPPPPSLDNFEMQFDEQFLAPPKPGGFGQARHWPVQYLHKELPPNITDSEARLSKSEKMKDPSSKLTAIQNLINIINSNELKNVEYQITNKTDSMDDILLVKIPLPSNFTKEVNRLDDKVNDTTNKLDLQVFEDNDAAKNNTKRSSKDLSVNNPSKFQISDSTKSSFSNVAPVYRRSYIVRANVSSHASHRRNWQP